MAKKIQKKKSQKSPIQKPAESKPIASTQHPIQTIDATDQVLGRLATQVAILLRGKNKPLFRPYLLCGDKVMIINASKIRVTGNKMHDKLYYRHTGYIGHLKSTSMEELYRKNPSEIIRRAVRGMLPKNKLQDIWMKNLIIYN